MHLTWLTQTAGQIKKCFGEEVAFKLCLERRVWANQAQRMERVLDRENVQISGSMREHAY